MDIVGAEERMPARKPWITKEMVDEMEERRKWKHQSTDKARQECKRLNNKLRRTTEEAREKWWNEKCKELEDLQQKGRYDKVYEEVKSLCRKPGKGGGIEVRDKQGSILNESNEVRNRWKEYVEELYRSEDREMHDNQEVEEEIYQGMRKTLDQRYVGKR